MHCRLLWQRLMSSGGRLLADDDDDEDDVDRVVLTSVY